MPRGLRPGRLACGRGSSSTIPRSPPRSPRPTVPRGRRTSAALRARAPEVLAELDQAAGGAVEALAWRLAREAGIAGIRSIGVAQERLPDCAEAAAQRGDLALTPPPADAGELLRLYQQAW